MITERRVPEKAYAAFNVRDIDAVLAVMHADVDWPNGMEGGRVHGHHGVRDYWTRQWGMIDPHVEPMRIGPMWTGEPWFTFIRSSVIHPGTPWRTGWSNTSIR